MKITCPECNAQFSVDSKFKGHRGRCLKCGAKFIIGGEPSKTTAAAKPDNYEHFYSVKDLAKMLNVNPMTIYRMVSRGRLTCYQIGRAKRFRSSDIENFLKTCARGKSE